MLFNSYVFLFAFLPVTLIGFFMLGRRHQTLAAAWLAAASLVFYGWWDHRYIPLLLASICLNYLCSTRLLVAEPGRTGRKLWLGLAIAANLALLAYYKYAGFFVSSLNELAGTSYVIGTIVLPIGISFFTFTQIAFLVDTYQGKVRESRFIHYLLFVTYFPHLIAGPVLHHKEMMPQFGDARNYTPLAANFSVGLTIFTIGLAKKVLIADNLAPYANALFNAPGEPGMLLAWGGVLSFAFQLYFDFSGYSDMAIGLSRMFGIRLPLNFDSPYKARNIVEFWRCWHMTLSRFLRDYLYIPLGGNRTGKARRYFNLMATMVLGGLWHGAGWTFVIWGFLHGAYLVANHAWAALAARAGLGQGGAAGRVLATAITFVAVCVAWVFFRAADLATALSILKGMAGLFGAAMPELVADKLGPLKDVLAQLGMRFQAGGATVFVETWAWVLGAAFIAFSLPNAQEITRRFAPALDFGGLAPERDGRLARLLAWRATRGWALALGLLAVLSALSLNRPTDFLYFQF